MGFGNPKSHPSQRRETARKGLPPMGLPRFLRKEGILGKRRLKFFWALNLKIGFGS